MKETMDVKAKIDRQGKVKLHHAYAYKDADVKFVMLDMATKWGYIDAIYDEGDGIPGIVLSENDYVTGNKHPNQIAEEMTSILFPEYKGYDIMATTWSKYTLNICFVKYNK